MTKRMPEFECLECGKKFYHADAAQRASFNGCPKCGGVDIGIYLPGTPQRGVDYGPNDIGLIPPG